MEEGEVLEAPGSDGSAKRLVDQGERPEEVRTSQTGPLGPWLAQLCVLRTRAEAESKVPAAARATLQAREEEGLAALG